MVEGKVFPHLPCCRIVVLDSYDISTIEGLSAEKTERAGELLTANNPNDIHTLGVEWSLGLTGTDQRFMPYNGMLSDSQLAWLGETLKASEEQKRLSSSSVTSLSILGQPRS